EIFQAEKQISIPREDHNYDGSTSSGAATATYSSKSPPGATLLEEFALQQDVGSTGVIDFHISLPDEQQGGQALHPVDNSTEMNNTRAPGLYGLIYYSTISVADDLTATKNSTSTARDPLLCSSSCVILQRQRTNNSTASRGAGDQELHQGSCTSHVVLHDHLVPQGTTTTTSKSKSSNINTLTTSFVLPETSGSQLLQQDAVHDHQQSLQRHSFANKLR
ncbi:unnamed protein product, partial [Amoebophrya sp. A120]